jgi:hypothetical protein
VVKKRNDDDEMRLRERKKMIEEEISFSGEFHLSIH